MRTNLEKYNFYYDQFIKKFNLFVASMFPVMPTKMYELQSTKIRELDITGVDYRWVRPLEKPSKVDVEKMLTTLNSPLVEDDIYFHYKYTGNGYTSSGAFSVTTIKAKQRVSFNAEDFNEQLAINKEKYEPREGFSPCTYCRTQKPTIEMVSGKIIFLNSRNGHKFVDEKTNLYCTSQCHFNDQCAHEG